MTDAGVGTSGHRNPRRAGEEAASAALEEADIDEPDFVFMFSSVGYDQDVLLESVRETTGEAPLTGCSAEGIIAGQTADESNFQVAVMVVASDDISFENTFAEGLSGDPRTVGTSVGEHFDGATEDAVALFVLADGLTFNFDAFVGGLEEAFGSSDRLPLFGGTAADNWAMEQTYQFHNDEVLTDAVACALLRGDADIATDVNHGCSPIGGERTITKCDGNVIYEIDGKPVLEVLREYLRDDEIDNWDKAVVNLCLGFEAPSELQDDYDDYLIRFMPAKDDETGSINIPTEVEEGTSVWMTRRDRDKITRGVQKLGRSVHEQLDGDDPDLVLHFDCAGRGKVVAPQNVQLDWLETLQHQVSPDTPWIGFYTYGEIGPVGDTNCFHNYTAVLAAIH